MREEPLRTGIGCLTRLLGTYVLVVAIILYSGAKKEAQKEATNNTVTTGVEDELSQRYIVLSCNDTVFVMDYDEYDAFRRSDSPGTVFVDAMNGENTQSYVTRENIQELQVFLSYDEAVQYASGLNKGRTLG